MWQKVRGAGAAGAKYSDGFYHIYNDRFRSEHDGSYNESDGSYTKMIDFVANTMDFVLKVMDFVLKMMDFTGEAADTGAARWVFLTLFHVSQWFPNQNNGNAQVYTQAHRTMASGCDFRWFSVFRLLNFDSFSWLMWVYFTQTCEHPLLRVRLKTSSVCLYCIYKLKILQSITMMF